MAEAKMHRMNIGQISGTKKPLGIRDHGVMDSVGLRCLVQRDGSSHDKIS